MKTEITAKDYERRLGEMLQASRAWRKANPDKLVQVLWNYPRHVALIAPMSAAIKHRMVVPNEPGLELLQALGPWNCPEEPSVMMCRAVIEIDK